MPESNSEPSPTKPINGISPDGTSGDEAPVPQGYIRTNPPIPKPEKGKKETHYCKPDQTPDWEIWLASFGVLAAATAAIIYALQLCAFNRATNEATSTQIQTNMPLLLPFGVPVTTVTGPDGKPIFRVIQKFKNFGETRALNPVAYFGLGTSCQSPTPYAFREVHTWEKWTFVKGHEPELPLDLPIDKAQAISKINAPLYEFGKIRYDDAFAEDRNTHARNDHLIEWCIQVVRFNVDPPVLTGGDDVEGANCVDEYCPKEDYKNYRKN